MKTLTNALLAFIAIVLVCIAAMVAIVLITNKDPVEPELHSYEQSIYKIKDSGMGEGYYDFNMEERVHYEFKGYGKTIESENKPETEFEGETEVTWYTTEINSDIPMQIIKKRKLSNIHIYIQLYKLKQNWR